MYLFLLFLLALAILIPTAYAGLIGAPYAPTRAPVVHKAFSALKVTNQDTLVDFGCGDGKILLMANSFGAQAIGYELSPIMWFVSWVRSWGKKGVKVRFGDFYKRDFPQATIIFTFLMPEKMSHIKSYLKNQTMQRGRYLLSYMFPLPDTPPLTTIRAENCGPIYVYNLKQLTKS